MHVSGNQAKRRERSRIIGISLFDYNTLIHDNNVFDSKMSVLEHLSNTNE